MTISPPIDDAPATEDEHIREMLRHDRASSSLGMTLIAARPGFAQLSLVVRDDMLNGFDVMHGGFIFALADTAFAAACNETAAVTLAAGADISFLRPARRDQVLTATAQRRVLQGRSGLYDVTVADETGAVIAEFRGRSRTTTMERPTR